MSELTPREIVAELDRHIVGQAAAKRSVALALRNRWRWGQLPDDIRREVTPKNILMIGPTGVGKTEITRRLAKMTGAPLVKVEASKYTEVGYYGRDVESMVRDLIENAIAIVRKSKREEVQDQARQHVEQRLLELLLPEPTWEADPEQRAESQARHERTRQKLLDQLRNGKLEDRQVELKVDRKQMPIQVFSNVGMEQMDLDLQSMMDRIMPRQSTEKKLTIAEARDLLLEQEIEALMDQEAVQEESIRLAEETGIIFIDEIDKICGPEESGRSADVSRQGVQRDLLPIVEGTVVQSKYGTINTDHVLFIAAGAFHRSKPSDLMPELQGRFPIRVELQDLTREDFVRILTEPANSLTRQYQALLQVEGVRLKFTDDAIQTLADIAYRVNQSTQNIGARRLHTILERLLEDLSFEATELPDREFVVDAEYVGNQLREIVEDDDLSRFIL